MLRDMGYFPSDIFTAIQNKSAHWLSRLPANVKVSRMDRNPLDKLLKSRKNTHLDMIVRVGYAALECRLVALRADEKLATKLEEKEGKPAR